MAACRDMTAFTTLLLYNDAYDIFLSGKDATLIHLLYWCRGHVIGIVISSLLRIDIFTMVEVATIWRHWPQKHLQSLLKCTDIASFMVTIRLFQWMAHISTASPKQARRSPAMKWITYYFIIFICASHYHARACTWRCEAHLTFRMRARRQRCERRWPRRAEPDGHAFMLSIKACHRHSWWAMYARWPDI